MTTLMEIENLGKKIGSLHLRGISWISRGKWLR
jgi:hypothetical protein